MKTRIVAALAALLVWPVHAQDLRPAARLQFEFGGQRPLEGLRLRLLAETQDWRLRPSEDAAPASIASVELSLDQAPYSTLLGLPLQAHPDRSQAAEDSGGHTWLWVGAGVVGVVAVAALAVGGNRKEVNNGEETDVTVSCGIGGNVLSPGGPDINLGGCAP